MDGVSASGCPCKQDLFEKLWNHILIVLFQLQLSSLLGIRF
jgi:hypothetical protein